MHLRDQGSFRDPSGFIFEHNQTIYRQVNTVYQKHYDRLMQSGLYEALAKDGLLISHQEVNTPSLQTNDGYKTLKPTQVPFISYPYEWSFSQLKQAALCTLNIQRKAIEKGMILKDASAYNIQFIDSRPLLIDTLSFEIYQEGQPWVAYQQFCQHFLAPLALMHYKDIKLGQLLKLFIDGIPIDLAACLLPFKSNFKLSLFMHIHLLAKSQKKYGSHTKALPEKKVSKFGLIGIVDSLTSGTKQMKWKHGGTEWAHYYENTNYSETAMSQKHELVSAFLKQTKPKMVWDLGANDGHFSKIARDLGAYVVSFDIDPSAVEKNYNRTLFHKECDILPLILDLTNPSGGIGWANQERKALVTRGPADTIMALALIHHLAITNNVPLEMIASYFAQLCSFLIIEFVPKEDSQVKHLLATRQDIFDQYDHNGFTKAFETYFECIESKQIENSNRTLYLLKKK